MSSLKMTIPIKPQPKASVVLGKKNWYNPNQRLEGLFREFVVANLPHDFRILEGPLLVIVHFRLPTPKRLKKDPLYRAHGYPHTRRPDGDNLEKFMNDILKGIVFKDDCQIAWLLRSKTYTGEDEGSTTFFVKEIEDTAPPDYPQLLLAMEANINIEKPLLN